MTSLFNRLTGPYFVWCVCVCVLDFGSSAELNMNDLAVGKAKQVHPPGDVSRVC